MCIRNSRYGDCLNGDLTGRLGFGSVWSTDASSDYQLHADPALAGGADLLLRYNDAQRRHPDDTLAQLLLDLFGGRWFLGNFVYLFWWVAVGLQPLR